MQIKKLLRVQPIHSFLIGLYFISFIFIRNLDQLTVSMTYRSIFFNFILTGILFGISYLLFKSGRKAGIFCTLLLVGLFIYGFVYDHVEAVYFKGYWPFPHIHRFLLITYFLFYLVLFIGVYSSKRPHYTVNRILNLFVFVLFALNLPLLFFRTGGNLKLHDIANPFLAKSPVLNSIPLAKDSLPDIYYIILDGYANESVLKKYYGENNPSLYRYLRQKGFYIADSSRTNYPFTYPSLCSSLNVNYLDSAADRSNELIPQNLVCSLFKKANYRVVNIETGFAVTENFSLTDKTIRIKTTNEFENSLLQLTFLRIDDVLGFANYMRINSEIKQLNNFLKERGPKFSFIHIVCPHPPYVIDSMGDRKVRSSMSAMAWEPRDNYLQQLKWVSSKMQDFIDSVLIDSKQPPIIILQSDHGPWIQDRNPKNVYDARTKILNAFYLPDSIKTSLYPNITPVNSFRLVFSRIFHEKFPLLIDKPYPYSDLIRNITFKSYNR